MQMIFDFGEGTKITRLRDRLKAAFGRIPWTVTLDPTSQLIKSLISSKTLDRVSLQSYQNLVAAYPHWPEMMEAPPQEIEATIAAVTFAEAKAGNLRQTLRIIAASHPDFRLDFLGWWPLGRALTWLERLPGVGRKVSAATLNLSRLRRPAFVLDTHVLRVLSRYGFFRMKATTKAAYESMMPLLATWNADELSGLHVWVKYLGQTICRTEPSCTICPISLNCETASRSAGRASWPASG